MPQRESIPHARGPFLGGGRFEVEERIGRGGMGEVFAAKHAITGRRVALKVVRTDGRSAGRAGRFLREARIASALRHPNIVEVIDAFEEADGSAVLVMELLVGETLAQYRQRVGVLSLDEAASILVPVARAVLAAHRIGVVHRDLKPDNLFLASCDGAAPVPKVLDFGIAKVMDWTELGAGLAGSATNAGAIVGTPHYMAFEQAMSEKEIDARADIWSLGVILFEALAGRRPIVFETLGEMYAAFLQGSIPSTRETLRELPTGVADLLDRCLTIDRGQRLSDLAPFVEVLAPFASGGAADGTGGSVVAAAIHGPRAGRGSGAMVAIITAAAVAVGLVAMTLALRRDQTIVPYPLVETPGDTPSEPAMLASAARPATPAESASAEAPVALAGPASDAAAESSGWTRRRDEIRQAPARSVAPLAPARPPAPSTAGEDRSATALAPANVAIKKGILETPPY
jgi:eukaryotic-like serine/threonine-protein kinase